MLCIPNEWVRDYKIGVGRGRGCKRVKANPRKQATKVKRRQKKAKRR